MKTRILCVLNRLPYPVVGGREKMLCQALDFMARASCDIHLVVFEPVGQWSTIPDRFKVLAAKIPNIVDFTVLAWPGPVMCIMNVLIRTILLRKKSLQESLFFSLASRRALAKKNREVDPDIIYCDSARTAQFFESLTTRALKVFDADDLLSKRYRIMESGSVVADVNLLGSFAGKLPRLFKWLGSSLFSRALVRIEADLMYRRENSLARAFDRVILVSPVEEVELRNRIKDVNVHYIYPTVAVRNGDRPAETREATPTLAFMGLLNVPHNQIGLQGFLEKIFPKILDQVPDVRLTIIGANAPEKVVQLAARYGDHVVFTGFVENFAATLKSARVFVAPIYFGTGIKTKIIDAMALALPVVTTHIGAEGLSVRNREHLMIAQNDGQFADAVVELIRDRDLCDRIARQGRQYVREFHNPDNEALRFKDILGLKQS